MFELEPHDLPRELLVPLGNWFEAAFAFDYERLAGMYMELASDEDNLSLLQQGAMGHHPGTFRYARCVEGWYIEGHTATVTFRGVEHNSYELEEEPTTEEIAWVFEMMRIGNAWRVMGYTTVPQTSHNYPALPESRKPWLKRWRSGKVE